MSGNSFGRLFRVSTFGESHGEGIGVVIDGVPPNLHLSERDIQVELDRRRPGQSRITTARIEADKVRIISGLFQGCTTGTPLTLFIQNRGGKTEEYEDIKDVYRPGHADYTYEAKYGIRDWRGSGRASGRETAARVAAGAVAKVVLKGHGIEIIGYTLEIDGVRAERIDFSEIEKNVVRSPDKKLAHTMIERIEHAKAAGDSVGGIVEVTVKGVSPGIGDPVFDRLDALLAHAILSIGAVKGFEVGKGFAAACMKGSKYNDPYVMESGRLHTQTNNAGGILGGISTGEDIVLRAAVRPPASIARPQETVTRNGKKKIIEVHGRHDPCIVPRIVPVVEAMVGITIMDCFLIQKAFKNTN